MGGRSGGWLGNWSVMLNSTQKSKLKLKLKLEMRNRDKAGRLFGIMALSPIIPFPHSIMVNPN